MELKELVRKTSIETIRDELMKIAERHPEGLLVREDIVTAASHPDNPLHPLFEWDDTTAAHQHRLCQAGMVIRRVRVVPSNGSESVRSVPKYVSLLQDRLREGGGYRETATVIEDDDLRAQLEETAKKELQGWLDRHASLTELVKKVAEAAEVPLPKRRRGR